MGVSLKFSLLGFEVELTEFTSIVTDLIGVKLDQASKDALKTLLEEARKSFDVVVDVVTPLYALSNGPALRAQLPGLFAGFKNAYLKNGDAIRTHCHVVTDQIRRLKAGQAWKQNIPGARKAFKRLEESESKWVGSDDALADTMNQFLEAVNAGMEEINATLPSNPRRAGAMLQELLAGTEPAIKAIRAQLDQLTILTKSM